MKNNLLLQLKSLYLKRKQLYLCIFVFHKVSPYVLKHFLFPQGLTPLVRPPGRYRHLWSTNTLACFTVRCLFTNCWLGLIRNSYATSIFCHQPGHKNFCYQSKAWFFQQSFPIGNSLKLNKREKNRKCPTLTKPIQNYSTIFSLRR